MFATELIPEIVYSYTQCQRLFADTATVGSPITGPGTVAPHKGKVEASGFLLFSAHRTASRKGSQLVFKVPLVPLA